MPKLPMLGLALLLVHLTLGALSLAAARGGSRLHSVRLWGWGLIVYAAGLLLNNLDQVIDYGFCHVAGNLLIAASTVPLVQGLLFNSGKRIDKVWAGAALGVTGLVLAANNVFGGQATLINLIAPSPFAIGIFLYGGIVLWRHPLAAARDT